MFRNFIKTALRNLAKNKLISFINIFGLSIAIGCSLVVYIFIDFAYSQDQFHENKDNIFLLENVIARDGVEQLWGDSQAPLAELLKVDFPQIKRVTRIDNRGLVMKHEEKVFNEFMRFVDPEFLEMFTFPLLYGDKSALHDHSKVIISSQISEKYFGDDNPVGEQVEFIMNNKKVAFIIGGVAKPFPKTASFGFSLLANYNKKFAIFEKEDPNDWTDFINATFIELNDPKDIDVISSNMDKYIKLQNAADQDYPAISYPFQPFNTLSMNSYKIRGDISGGDDPTGRMVLLTIGAFMMLLAMFNYINISISSATKRLKEIGIRKVIGGTKRQLIFQFIGENLIICLLALIVGGVLARTMFGPWFDAQFNIGLELNFYENMNAWLFFLALLILTGIGSGAYPAFYISSFNAVNIFRGRQKFGKKNTFTKIFLTFQFVLSIITIVFGISFTRNAEYQQKQDWGYNQSQTLVVRVDSESTYKALSNEFLQNPNVVQMAGSANHVGQSVGIAVVEYLDKKYDMRRIDVGYDYLETLGIRLKEGRFFDKELVTDLEESVVINQQFVENMGWESAIGKSFNVDTLRYSVIGVVENFHYDDFSEKIEPTFFRMAKEENYRYLSMRLVEGKAAETEELAETLWKKYAPDTPYNAFFQDEVFDRYFNNLKGHGRIMGFTAMLAIILSCMGLYGLVSLNVATRMKEFSIRKVLGAGVASIFKGVNRQYVWLIGIACVVGLPLGFIMVEALFDDVYEYHMPMNFVPLAMAASFIFAVALLTISTQIYKVVKSNPVDALRNE